MEQLQEELVALWEADRPGLVVADFVLPVAGLTAKRMGIDWWTGMPTPCVLETGDGVPSYLGGWKPRSDWYGRCRDQAGRAVVRAFKLGVRKMFDSQFRALSISSVYRSDGLEVAYSPTRVLGFGLRDFEFAREWPDHFDFIGPLTESPPFAYAEPPFAPGKRHVLVTLGTHLPWARRRAYDLIRRVAAAMPAWVFHFSDGEPGSLSRSTAGNLIRVGFLPYGNLLPRYDAAIMHGGTGITYACIESGVPMLVWPHDYDQFDHAARIVERGLGLRLTPSPKAIKQDLGRLCSEATFRDRLEHFRSKTEANAAERRFRELVEG
ncbi:MAG: nucleotide disphospho-sugar-binding domain-containing protein [Planctomycetota bacterium]